MTRDDIIRMAREAGFRVGPSRDGPDDVLGVGVNLERFASLVAAAERETVLQTIEALYDTQDPNPMYQEGYNHALDNLKEFVKARGQE